MNVKFRYVVGAVFWIADLTVGKWVANTIHTDNDWTFIARFCFLSKRGALTYNFLYPVEYETEEILLYYDEPGQWETVYKSNKNCSERRSVLSEANNQIIALNASRSVTSRYSGCSFTTHAEAQYYNCTGARTFRSLRERWWYIAVARCHSDYDQVSGLYLKYQLHMTNGEPSDFWHYEFSADEFYILLEDILFLVIYVLMIMLSIVCAVLLRSRQLFHSTYKIYIVALALWFFGLMLQCAAWGQYGESGWQKKRTEVAGRLFQAASIVIFILMLILLAKGFTITRGRLSQMSVVRITVFFILFTIIYITLFIWEGLFFDEGLVLYFYESPPGYGLTTMRLIGWLWFLYAIFFTLKHNPNKANFYFPFFIFYTLWFWAGPVVVLVAMFVMTKWSREKTVNAVEQFVGLSGHLFFLILTRPSAANRNFPYHVRTSQIAALVESKLSDTSRPDSTTYHIDLNSRLNTEEIPRCTGPNLAALFVVQDSAKTKPDENCNTGRVDTMNLPPPYKSVSLPSQRLQTPSSNKLALSSG